MHHRVQAEMVFPAAALAPFVSLALYSGQRLLFSPDAFLDVTGFLGAPLSLPHFPHR